MVIDGDGSFAEDDRDTSNSEDLSKYLGFLSNYSIFLELRSPLVRGTPILDLSFLGSSGPHGAIEDASRLIKPCKNAGFGVWGSGSLFPYFPFKRYVPLFG